MDGTLALTKCAPNVSKLIDHAGAVLGLVNSEVTSDPAAAVS
jgi:hypothetical protein